MNLEALYPAFLVVVTVAWLPLILAPSWVWTDRLLHRVWLPAALALWLIGLQVAAPPPPRGAGFATVQAVVLLASGVHGTLMLWTQAMGMDLFIGAWLARDARRRGIHHAWVILCLLSTYRIGPPGLLLYFIIRGVLRGTLTLQEVNTVI